METAETIERSLKLIEESRRLLRACKETERSRSYFLIRASTSEDRA
jgi:hypothetical protein